MGAGWETGMPERRILLLRHAKSSWRDAALADHDRPLNRRGTQAAGRMGSYLAEAGLLPDLVLCSTAVRTKQTWKLASKAMGKPAATLRMRRALYHATPSDLLMEIRQSPDEVETLMLVGHNPGLELLTWRLAGPDSDAAAQERLQRKYPTAGLAVLRCPEGGWDSIDEGRCRLQSFVTPAALETV